MNVVESNDKPATKLIDSKGKTLCQNEEIKEMLSAFQNVFLSDVYQM